MAFATVDEIKTRYEVIGSGPPLLMYAPAGFDATLEKWTTQGVYTKIKLLDHLPKKYSCIIFDRRECGHSGGRVERVTWADYVRQGKGLLEHLGYKRAHIMGGCMGCCPVMQFGVLHPEMVASMVLFWPVGGAKYRMNTHQRFMTHLAFVQEQGLTKVVELAASSGKSFGADPRGGPWASVIRNDAEFAAAYAKLNADQYILIVTGMMRTLFDRDTSPGAEPEDLLRVDIPALVVPGRDTFHATSAARYVEECLPRAEYWDVPVAGQTEETVAPRILEFLDKSPASAL
ncbi:MAG TPA: alpha/beta hydrolase [Micropepsaceae bacterium]|nr:alpha/beta hydrolase [Micropepsaceae bacterium]